jgi:hypothetical protein
MNRTLTVSRHPHPNNMVIASSYPCINLCRIEMCATSIVSRCLLCCHLLGSHGVKLGWCTEAMKRMTSLEECLAM